ncbi:MAG: choice-of-anchor D domain-containing protein [Deltaproteobacteria bacterium]|nr:choice-of-anchor D domain-containing protein [Deltaproteobacteria bacterium]
MRLRALLPVFLAVAACADAPINLSPDAAPVAASGAPAPTPPVDAPADFVPGEMIVKLDHAVAKGVAIELGGRRVTPTLEIAPGTWLVELDRAAMARSAVRPEVATTDAIAAVAGAPGVIYAQSNDLMQASRTPNDDYYPDQAWHFDQSRIPAAWDLTTGPAIASSVKIAVLDTGRTNHPDITWGENADFSVNPADNDATNDFTYHHGVMVAGIIGARTNTSDHLGTAGVCWSCEIMPVRVVDSSGTHVDTARAASALRWVAGLRDLAGNLTDVPIRAKVVNFSFNSTLRTKHCDDDPTFRDALAAAIARGVTVVIAAGNEHWQDGVGFPADCPDVIAVAASQQWNQVATYSNRGVGTDLTAPGGGNANGDITKFWGVDVPLQSCPRINSDAYSGDEGIVSTWTVARSGVNQAITDHCYRHSAGTSFAAPHVSGVVGLMLSVRPTLTPAQIKQVLRLTALPADADIWSFQCGSADHFACGTGHLDASAAVQAVLPPANPALAKATPARIDLAPAPIGTSTVSTISVSNVGFATLDITSATLTGDTSQVAFAYASGACQSGTVCNRTYSIIPNGPAVAIPVRCTVSGFGPRYADLELTSNTLGTLVVPIMCQGPSLAPSPSLLTFGSVPVGGSVTKTVTLTNVGLAPITGITATASPAPFARTGALPAPIDIGNSATIAVTCTPTAAGTFSGALTINNSSGLATTVSLSCTGTPPAAPILSAPSTFDVGDVRVGTFVDRGIALTNSGNAPLTITGATVNNPTFTVISTPGPIAAQNSGALTVRCKPTLAGSYSAILTVNSDGGTANITLSCRGVASVLGATPNPLAFGGVRVGTSVDATVTVTNSGLASLNLSSATVSGGCFSRIGGLPGPIAPSGGTATITVRCTPGAMVDYSGSLVIVSDGGALTIPLLATGTTPVLAVTSTQVPFGDVRVGTSSTQVVGLKNTGNMNLTVNALTIGAAPFNLASPIALPATIHPNETVNVNVACAPTAPGVFASTLAVASDGGSANISLTCRGVASVLGATPNPLAFGGVRVGTFVDRTVTVTNSGLATLNLSNAIVSGGCFSRIGALPGPIAPSGGTAMITVRCTASSTVSYSGSLVLTSDGGSLTIPLTATGIAPLLTVSPDQVAFGDVRVGTVATGVVSLTNSGGAPLTVTGLTIWAAPFGLSSPVSLPATIGAGETVNVNVTCAPTTAASFSTTLAIASDGGAVNISLVCRGVAPVLQTTTWLQFPDAMLGTTTSVTSTVTNVGTAPLHVTSATLAGSPAFALTGGLPAAIAPGASANLTITCTPTAVGAAFGTLTLNHDGATSPTAIGLYCYGAAGRVELLQPASGVLTLAPGIPQQVVIRNAGVGPLNLGYIAFFGDDVFTTSDITFPLTLAAGDVVSWSVTCQASGKALGSYGAKLFLKHDGLDGNASLLWVECAPVGKEIEPPADPIEVPVDPIDVPVDPIDVPVDPITNK